MAAGLMAVALRLDGLPELDRDEVPAQDVLVGTERADKARNDVRGVVSNC
jgi:hypothetical protein